MGNFGGTPWQLCCPPKGAFSSASNDEHGIYRRWTCNASTKIMLLLSMRSDWSLILALMHRKRSNDASFFLNPAWRMLDLTSIINQGYVFNFISSHLLSFPRGPLFFRMSLVWIAINLPKRWSRMLATLTTSTRCCGFPRKMSTED